jgi:hypothetical protein
MPLQDEDGFCGQCGTRVVPPQAEIFTAPAPQSTDGPGSSAVPPGPVPGTASIPFTPPPAPPPATPPFSASGPASNADAAGPADGMPASPPRLDFQQELAPTGKSAAAPWKSNPGMIVLLIAAVVLLVVIVAVISNHKVDTLLPEGVTQLNKPDTDNVAASYLNALTNDTIGESFWQYDRQYNSELDSIESNVPRDMWTNKSAQLRQQWQSNIEAMRRNTQSINNEQACWYVVKPGATVTITETRPNSVDASGSSNEWRVFANVSYSNETNAPLYQSGPGQRPIKNATFIMNKLQSDDGAEKRTFMSNNCTLVTESIFFWPVPPITNEMALAFVRNLSLNRTVTLVAKPELGQEGGTTTSEDWSRLTDRVKSLELFYQSHGFQTEGFQISYGYWYIYGFVHPPANWEQYRVGDDMYRLNESTDIQLISLENHDNSAIAQVKLLFRGCTIVCSLLNDLNKQSNLGHYVIQNYSSDEWPREVVLTVSYLWDPIRGWTLGEAK